MDIETESQEKILVCNSNYRYYNTDELLKIASLCINHNPQYDSPNEDKFHGRTGIPCSQYDLSN